jgi:hypothetical protein
MTLASFVPLLQGALGAVPAHIMLTLRLVLILSSAVPLKANQRSEGYYSNHAHLFNMQIKFFLNFLDLVARAGNAWSADSPQTSEICLNISISWPHN